MQTNSNKQVFSDYHRGCFSPVVLR